MQKNQHTNVRNKQDNVRVQFSNYFVLRHIASSQPLKFVLSLLVILLVTTTWVLRVFQRQRMLELMASTIDEDTSSLPSFEDEITELLDTLWSILVVTLGGVSKDDAQNILRPTCGLPCIVRRHPRHSTTHRDHGARNHVQHE